MHALLAGRCAKRSTHRLGCERKIAKAAAWEVASPSRRRGSRGQVRGDGWWIAFGFWTLQLPCERLGVGPGAWAAEEGRVGACIAGGGGGGVTERGVWWGGVGRGRIWSGRLRCIVGRGGLESGAVGRLVRVGEVLRRRGELGHCGRRWEGGGQSRVEVEVEAELRRAGTRRGGGTVIGGQRC